MVVGLWVNQVSAQKVSYLWDTGDTTAFFQANPTQTTTYFVTVTQYGLSYVDSVTVVVNQTSFAQVSATICDNETFTTAGGKTLSTAGVYYDTLQSIQGCDSVIETLLQVYPTYFTQVFDTMCSNDYFATAGGQIITSTGVYYDTLQSNLGCDSVIETNLHVNPNYFTQVSAGICPQDTIYSATGKAIVVPGVYFDTLQSAKSCDSIVQTTVQLYLTSFTQQSIQICANNHFVSAAGKTYTQPGIYVDTLTNAFGCDSLIATYLQVNPTYLNTNNITICSNQNYTTPGGKIVNTAGYYYDTLATINGCDSIIATQLLVNSNYFSQQAQSICNGSTFVSPSGKNYYIAGNYFDTLTTVNGCDSVIETALTVNQTYFSLVKDTICMGDSFILANGNVVTTQGIYQNMYQTKLGCDSLKVVQLVVLPSYHFFRNVSACFGQSVELPNGSVVAQSGTYTNLFSNVHGCDSIIETSVTFYPNYLDTLEAVICQGDRYQLPDKRWVTVGGVYQSTFQTAYGCDSSIVTKLKVNNKYNFKKIVGAEKVKQFNNYRYAIDSFPNQQYNWSLVGGSFVADSTKHYTWVKWTTTTQGTIEVEVNDNNQACYFQSSRTIEVAKSVTNILENNGENSFDFSVVPNPNNGNFYVLFNSVPTQNCQVQIFTLQGSLIKSFNVLKGQKGVDLNENLAQGSYLIRVLNTDGSFVKPFIVR